MMPQGAPFLGAASAPADPNRPIHEFDIPDNFQGDSKVKTIGFVELTLEEEARAVRRAGGDQVMLAFELWKEALAEVNGVRVTLGDGSADLAIKAFSPMQRAFAMSAYAEVNSPKEKEVANFLKSRRVKR